MIREWLGGEKMVFKDLPSDLWLPEKEGDSMIGVLVKKEVGNFGLVATLELEDGSEIKLPAHKALQAKMERVQLNTRVKIEYRGDTPTKKGSPMRLYRVQIWSDEPEIVG